MKIETQSSLRRAIRIIKALKGATITGRSNSELANELEDSPANISRCLAVMCDEGFVIKLDNGRYALGMQILQIARSHLNELDREQGRLAEINQRISAGAMR